jgi:saccharopine dehydrogenase (NAD+, L-lysine forming)
MTRFKIGVIREGKTPPDKRVPLTPQQCALVKTKFPGADVVVQTSEVRAFKDQEYRDAGVEVVESLADCDLILGVKEVNVEDLIPGKKFMFFSHTIKKQPYNRELLRAILDKKIQLIDYEVLKNRSNKRLIGFGRYAGIVGCYNGFRAYGEKTGDYSLLPANQCEDRKEMEAELEKVTLAPHTKILLTGFGRVGYGAREILDLLPITEVSPEEFLTQEFGFPVYCHLDIEDYYARKSDKGFEKAEFYESPELYESTFGRYITKADMYVACHFWSSKSPYILTGDDLAGEELPLKVIADISCDVAGPIASTVRSSKISEPFYGFDPKTLKETHAFDPGAITVMAVDNLPCELPKDASEDFGNELIRQILPLFFAEDTDKIIERASETTHEGKLSPYFAYLQDYVDGETVSH